MNNYIHRERKKKKRQKNKPKVYSVCIQSIGKVGRVSVSAENLEWPF